MTKLPSYAFKPNSTQPVQPLASTQCTTGSPPPSLTSSGTGAKGLASPSLAAASEHCSVTVCNRCSGAASVTVTQCAPATSRLRAKRGFCPRTIEVNPNPNHKSLRAIGDVLLNGLLVCVLHVAHLAMYC
jgi:hypothetical protein